MQDRDYKKDSRLRASDELRQALIQRKRPGDSYEDVIWRLLDQQEALDELVELWLSEYSGYDNDPSQVPNSGHQARCEQINKCVEDLQDVLEGDV